MTDLFIRSLRIDWNNLSAGSYLQNIPSVRGIDQLSFDRSITFFVGENGSGKSTLLEAIAVAYGFNPEGGTINYHFSTYDDVSPLSDALTLVKGYSRPLLGYFFRAETFFNVATVGMVEYKGEDYHSNSHGEGFLAFMQGFDKPGLYIMDEPEAALSPMRLLTLMAEMDALVKDNSQFIIATHSPILMTFPGSDIWEFSKDGIQNVCYKDTEHYKTTKQFLNNPEKMLHYLLNDE